MDKNTHKTPDCLTGSYTPEACERQLVREIQATVTDRCSCGGKLTYKHGVGGLKCWNGGLYRANGQIVRECPKARS